MRAVWLLVATLTVTLGPVYADRLELSNGDRVSGTIVSMDEETVVIRTDYGDLAIARSQIARGEFGTTGEADEEAGADPDLVFHFPMDATLEDRTGSHTLVNNGLQYGPDREGQPRSALRSDGSGTYLSIAPNEELNRLSTFTLSFSVRLEPNQGTRYLVSKWNRADGTTADGKLTLQTAGGGLTLYLVDPDGQYHWLRASGALTEFVWQTVTVVFAAGRATVYVDGTVAASKAFTFTELYTDDAPLLIMTAVANTDDPYGHYNVTGSVDDLRLYARALSAAEVAALAGISAATD